MQTASLTSKSHQGDRVTPQLPKQRQRLLDIDRAKAIAIIFVVAGHISDPQGPEWANVLRVLIYNFHMPFFMYLSGFVFVYASSHLLKRSLWNYISSRANRLLVPFFIMAIVVITLKTIASQYTDLNRSASSLIANYQFILINTQQSPALDLWYLFVLFVFSIFTPLFYRLCQNRFWPLLVASVVMYALFADSVTEGGLTDNFYFSRMCWFYVFFIGGCLACRHSNVWLPFIGKFWPLALLLFIAADIGTLGLWPLDTPWRYLIVGVLSAGGIHGAMRLQIWDRYNILLCFADNAFSIYLFNTIFIATSRAVLVHFVSPSEQMWLFYAVGVPVGLIGPIAIRYAFLRFAVTRPIAFYLG